MKRIAGLAAAILTTASSLVLAPAGAHADSPSPVAWTRELLPDVQPTQLQTSPDGSVTGAGCGGTTPSAAVTVDSTNASVTKVSSSGSPRPCPSPGQWAVGIDGTIFTPAFLGGSEKTRLAAYQNGQPVWPNGYIELPAACDTVRTYLDAMAAGANGDLYIVSGSNGCSPDQSYLSRISAADGRVIFSRAIGAAGVSPADFTPYDAGLIIKQDATLRFFDYDGQESAPVQLPSLPANTQSGMEASPEGHVFFGQPPVTPPTDCVYNDVSAAVVGYGLAGPLGNPYQLEPCSSIVSIHPAPWGGVLLATRTMPRGGADTNHLIALKADGTLLWQKELPTIVGGDINGPHRVFDPSRFDARVDAYGNVVVLRRYNLVYPNGTRHIHWQAEVRYGVTNGNVRQSFYTDSIAQLSDYELNPLNAALANDRLYIAATVNASQPILHAIDLPGLGFDYPRAAILGAGQAKLNYVAMGDSYSSGEGVPPFEPESEHDGCHRSLTAYPRQLGADTTHAISLQGFVACSGATTDNLINGQAGEPPQINALDAKPDVVSLTVGGDDIGFPSFAKECVIGDCSGEAYNTAIEKVHTALPAALRNLFAQISGKLGTSTSTRVLVVGYPMLIPDLGTAISPPNCSYLTPAERSAIRNLVAELNGAISAAVADAGPPFEFVSATYAGNPFDGHELCIEGNYFNGVNPIDSGYSFHPNALGHRAYEQIIAKYLSIG